MMFVYHYVIIPFNPQYLPKHAPLILQGGRSQRGGSWWLRTAQFSLLKFNKKTAKQQFLTVSKAANEPLAQFSKGNAQEL